MPSSLYGPTDCPVLLPLADGRVVVEMEHRSGITDNMLRYMGLVLPIHVYVFQPTQGKVIPLFVREADMPPDIDPLSRQVLSLVKLTDGRTMAPLSYRGLGWDVERNELCHYGHDHILKTIRYSRSNRWSRQADVGILPDAAFGELSMLTHVFFPELQVKKNEVVIVRLVGQSVSHETMMVGGDESSVMAVAVALDGLTAHALVYNPDCNMELVTIDL